MRILKVMLFFVVLLSSSGILRSQETWWDGLQKKCDAEKPLLARAESGDVNARSVLIHTYDFGTCGSERNSHFAFWLKAAAEAGNASAPMEEELGRLYLNGDGGLPKNYTQAAYWFSKAAEHGDANAQYLLALRYEGGEGVTKDSSKALDLYQKAAQNGSLDSQLYLCEAYQLGTIGPQDYEKAGHWCRKAAEQGNEDGEYNLAGILDEGGKGVIENSQEAAYWYRKAAEQNNPPAAYCLGHLYLVGRGVAQDYEEAYFWFDVAAGSEIARENTKLFASARDAVASRLTPDRLNEAQERARKWLESHQGNSNQ